MATVISPLAGKPAPQDLLVDVSRLVTAYYTGVPDPSVAAATRRRSAPRGTAARRSNAASTNRMCSPSPRRSATIAQARASTARFSWASTPTRFRQPACASALEVLAANGVEVMLAADDEYTPTPAVSHAILTYNRGRTSGLADGIVVTPSHNPPDNGGFKYNPPNGGPADETSPHRSKPRPTHSSKPIWHGRAARCRMSQALRARDDAPSRLPGAPTSADLGHVIDMDAIRGAERPHGCRPARRRRRALLGAASPSATGST